MDAIPTPNKNKSIGAGAGVLSGGAVGFFVVGVIHLYFKIDISPEWASAISTVATGVLAIVGAFLAPLFTAAQEAAIRHLDAIDCAHAEAVVSAVQTASVKRE